MGSYSSNVMYATGAPAPNSQPRSGYSKHQTTELSYPQPPLQLHVHRPVQTSSSNFVMPRNPPTCTPVMDPPLSSEYSSPTTGESSSSNPSCGYYQSQNHHAKRLPHSHHHHNRRPPTEEFPAYSAGHLYHTTATPTHPTHFQYSNSWQNYTG
eukprot:TRINITY_DN75_c0_g1_i1.p1 TRINITY_DN75_c0_g1~~TRINITY_DN75_c0_g1_i1.p1  ORF type:complete len:164 (+),score=9.26 TRINITY_DN75_c0_g1_i1:36-494(+)